MSKKKRIKELERQLESLSSVYRKLCVRMTMYRAVVNKKAIDPDTALLLAMARGQTSSGSMTAEEIVDQLKQEKPFLFHDTRNASCDSKPGLTNLAERAAESGDRSELLRYLRARRSL